LIRLASRPAAPDDAIHLTSTAGNVDVPISLFVAASGPALALNTAGVSFQTSQNTPSSAKRSVEVLDIGDAASTVNWTTTLLSGSNWLSLDSSSGTASPATPGALTLALAPGGAQLAPGVYYALIKISDPNSLNSVQYVTAMLSVESNSNALLPDFAPAGLVFTATVGGAAPPSQQVQLNGGSSVLQAATSTADNGTWLSAQLTSGALSVSANPTALAAGIYSGSVTVSSGEVLRSVNVTLIVLGANCAASKLALTEIGLGNDFNPVAGLPAVLNVQLYDDCASPVTTGSVTASFSNGDAPLALVGDSLGNYTSTWQPGNVTADMVVTLNAFSGIHLAVTDRTTGAAGSLRIPLARQ
jgi:hypothetical protein